MSKRLKKETKHAKQTNKKSGLGFLGKHLRTQPKAGVCRITHTHAHGMRVWDLLKTLT